MKSIILVALAFAAVAVAAPTEYPKVLQNELEQQPDGSYVSRVETENGITREEIGELKQVVNEENKSQTVLVVRGTYGYPRDDGTQETIEYLADENGFQPKGPSIPKVERR